MENITVKDIVEATGGKLLCGDENKWIKKISTNSREMDQDTLFVPIIGERVNAHKFIESALEGGGAALTQEHDEMSGESPFIRVADTLRALQDLAAYYRKRINVPVVAVTGSVGKTTTREMITQALAAKYKVFSTIGNFNSQVGVPLTLSRLSEKDEIAVLEAGISQFGEMDQLVKMIDPQMVVLTNIGVAHIEQLKTQDNICIEKMKLASNLPASGITLINGDDAILVKHSKTLSGKVITYGLSAGCDYRATEITMNNDSIQFICNYQGNQVPVTLGVLGEHNVQNALAAIAIAHLNNIEPAAAAKQFEQFRGSRQQVHNVNGYTLIDDTYNASPDSMKASIKVLSDMREVSRKTAVLADMLELGEEAQEFHYDLGRFIGTTDVNQVFVLGDLSKNIAAGIKVTNAKINTVEFDDIDKLADFIKEDVKKGDALLFKGSNGMHLKDVANLLIK